MNLKWLNSLIVSGNAKLRSHPNRTICVCSYCPGPQTIRFISEPTGNVKEDCDASAKTFITWHTAVWNGLGGGRREACVQVAIYGYVS